MEITTAPSHLAAESEGRQPSTPSAPIAFMPKSNPANGFAAVALRTAAHDADGSGQGNAPIVRDNTLKANCVDDGLYGRNAPAPIRTAKVWGARLECAPMNAALALTNARAAGIRVEVDGDDLVLEASAPPPATVVDGLSRFKGEIVALLRPDERGWSAEDWQVFFAERAGVLEFDGGLPRPEADARAFARCVEEWLNRNPARSAPGRCLGCPLDAVTQMNARL
jgi:hypothetical protein